MNIIKRHRNLLVCISVIAFLLSSCLPVMDSVTLVGFKNCTNDTLIIGESDCNDIDMFQKLINEGVDINERDYNNLTALWYLLRRKNKPRTKGNTRDKGFFCGFSWGNMDFCISLQSGIQ